MSISKIFNLRKMKINNIMSKIIKIFIVACIFVACNKTVEADPPEKIFEKYKSSVVLIASQFYYEVYVNNTIYYYSPSSAKKIYFNKEVLMQNLSFSTGTGFIISEKGEIITNNHVVNQKDENYKNEINTLFFRIKNMLVDYVAKYSDTLNIIKTEYNQYEDQLSDEQKQNFQNDYDVNTNKKNIYAKLYADYENIDISSATSKLVIYKLGIAYNDTHITEFDDLQECVVVKTSEDEKIDLALIQTKNKTFDKKPNYILNFNDNNPNFIENPKDHKEREIKNPLKINQDVFMIGFNRGFSLANTKQGIKAQFTSGKISQESDGERILYTIPTLEGSSGSPIVDKWGNLVGVNFAKLTNSQSFSFGVPVYEVKKFYEE